MMDINKSGALIRSLRLDRGMTQRELGERLHVSDRTVSKWERGAGSPEVSILQQLASVFDVRVESLLSGELTANRTDSGNMMRLRFYRCPICGNLLTATGAAAVTCCGRTLQPLTAREPDDAHAVSVERMEDEDHITLKHPMTKEHYLSFIAQVDSGRLLLMRLYPEQAAEIRLPHMRRGRLFYACSQDGLFVIKPSKG